MGRGSYLGGSTIVGPKSGLVNNSTRTPGAVISHKKRVQSLGAYMRACAKAEFDGIPWPPLPKKLSCLFDYETDAERVEYTKNHSAVNAGVKVRQWPE